MAVERVSRIEQDSASKKDIPPTVGKAAAPLAKSLAPPAEGGIDQASVKPSATDGKQKNSISENENLLAQYAKNNLPDRKSTRLNSSHT